MERNYSWSEIANMPLCCICCGSRNVDIKKDICLSCGSDEGIWADESEEEIKTCNVCKKKDQYENMIMDIREILECSELRIRQWEKQNPNIDLYGWFCMPCCEKFGNEIEDKS